jgi:iron complex outermembrane recepter protein
MKSLVAAVILGSFAFLATSPVNAQASKTDAADTLSEVVVTAQRRAQNSQDVPMSITAITGDELLLRHINSPGQLVVVAPGLQLSTYNAALGATNFLIRGVGNINFAHTIEPSVVTVIDDVPMIRPELAIADFVDVADVEVLDGPQGTLFGRNASAGVISIRNNRPLLNKFEASSHAEFGRFDAASTGNIWLTQGTLNAPLSESSAFRINYSFLDNDPTISALDQQPAVNLAKEQNTVRGQLRFDLTRELSTTIGAEYTRSIGMGDAVVTARFVPVGSIAANPGIVPGPDNLVSGASFNNNAGYSVYGITDKIDYGLGNGATLSNILSWRRFNADLRLELDNGPAYILGPIDSAFTFSQQSEELRLASPEGGPLEYQFGLYAMHGSIDRYDVASGSLGHPTPLGYTAFFGGIDDAKVTPHSLALYGQTTLAANDRLKVTMGARATRDTVSFTGFTDSGGYFVPAGLPGYTNLYKEDHARTHLTWRLSPEFIIAADAMGYVAVATGYKGTGYNSASAGAAPVSPETSIIYEGGFKSMSFAQRLMVNVAAYYEKFTDFQEQSNYFLATGVNQTLISNASGVSTRGGELHVSALPASNFKLSADVAFVDAHFDDYSHSPCYGGQTIAQGCVSGVYNASGNRLPSIPKWTEALSADYGVPIGESLKLSIRGSVYARSQVFFQATNEPQSSQSGYGLFDASLGLNKLQDKWRLSLFCRNCLDKRFVTQIQPTPIDSKAYQQSFGWDSFRRIGLSADIRF